MNQHKYKPKLSSKKKLVTGTVILTTLAWGYLCVIIIFSGFLNLVMDLEESKWTIKTLFLLLLFIVISSYFIVSFIPSVLKDTFERTKKAYDNVDDKK